MSRWYEIDRIVTDVMHWVFMASASLGILGLVTAALVATTGKWCA